MYSFFFVIYLIFANVISLLLLPILKNQIPLVLSFRYSKRYYSINLNAVTILLQTKVEKHYFIIRVLLFYFESYIKHLLYYILSFAMHFSEITTKITYNH